MADRPATWWTPGTGLAFLGVLAFSATLPMTRFAVAGIDAAVVGAGRTVGAGLIAAGVLLATRTPVPPRQTWGSFLVVALGVGIGFGFFSSLALRTESAAHAAVVIALLPVATAVVATVRGHDRPGRAFWAASSAGTAVVLLYVVGRSGFDGVSPADGLLLLATACAAAGYAEGGRLATTMPGWQVISWGLVGALPVAVPVTLVALSRAPAADPAPSAYLGLAYLIVVSMFVGFVAWYRGLAEAGVARASQVQLLQPLLTVGWAALLLGEDVPPETVGAAALVVVCIAVTQRARIGRTPQVS